MLPQKKRVSKRSFPLIMRSRKVISRPAFSLRVLPLNEGSKVSVVVSKAVSKSAVTRNTLRRRFYSAIAVVVPKTGTYVFFLKKEAAQYSFKDICESVTEVFLSL